MYIVFENSDLYSVGCSLVLATAFCIDSLLHYEQIGENGVATK
jgi:hypothetical protein